MFYRSLSPIERAHVAEAFTFELGKVHEQAIKERELQVLANVDTSLCEQVAAGLGLPAPKGKPAQDALVSPALAQILAEPGPIDGRKVGIIADSGADLVGIAKLVKATAAVGATALVIAPVGGLLTAGSGQISWTGRWRRRGPSSSTRSWWPRAQRPRRTSNSWCCCRKRSGTAKPSPRGAMVGRFSKPHASRSRGQAFQVADDWINLPPPNSLRHWARQGVGSRPESHGLNRCCCGDVAMTARPPASPAPLYTGPRIDRIAVVVDEYRSAPEQGHRAFDREVVRVDRSRRKRGGASVPSQEFVFLAKLGPFGYA